jgi:hypothetical protein
VLIAVSAVGEDFGHTWSKSQVFPTSKSKKREEKEKEKEKNKAHKCPSPTGYMLTIFGFSILI